MNRARLASHDLSRGDLLVAPLAGVAGMIASYAIAGLTPEFVAGPIAGFLARTMPGVVVTFTILVLGSLGAALNFGVAILLGTVILAGTTLLGLLVARRAHESVGIRLEIPAVILLCWVASAILTGAAVAAAATGIAAGAVVGLAALAERAPDPSREFSPDRRRLLGGLVGTLLVGVLGVAARAGSSVPSPADGSGAEPAGQPITGGEEVVNSLLGEAAEQSLDIEGIEPLVSRDFYRVDINATDPLLDAEEWSLAFTGAVDEEFSISYDELTSKPAEHRFITLRCVGESLNGHKMDNALWTGIPIAEFVERAGPNGGCECVMLRAADGYFEEFPLAALRRGFLAWGMNGKLLPRPHGYPVRALIPGHWGEINVKWLTKIEILDQQVDGYWERRGWHGTGPVNTVAKLHAINRLMDGRIQVGGHAYAGIRGIDRVEVSIDGGRTWTEATLSEPLPGEDVWRQWKLEYVSPGQAHEVVVRATDGEGTLQPANEASAFPSGPSGWVRRTVTL